MTRNAKRMKIRRHVMDNTASWVILMSHWFDESLFRWLIRFCWSGWTRFTLSSLFFQKWFVNVRNNTTTSYCCFYQHIFMVFYFRSHFDTFRDSKSRMARYWSTFLFEWSLIHLTKTQFWYPAVDQFEVDQNWFKPGEQVSFKHKSELEFDNLHSSIQASKDADGRSWTNPDDWLWYWLKLWTVVEGRTKSVRVGLL